VRHVPGGLFVETGALVPGVGLDPVFGSIDKHAEDLADIVGARLLRFTVDATLYDLFFQATWGERSSESLFKIALNCRTAGSIRELFLERTLKEVIDSTITHGGSAAVTR
jgi:hypothetical protein